MADGPRSRRLFVALMLGEPLGARVAGDVRRALGLRDGQAPPRQLRPVGARDLHLTLFFLGAVAAERRAPLEAALGAAVEGLAAPRLELARAGAFPAPGRPRVLWLGVGQREPGALDELVEAVRSACVGEGFEADPRPFAAHVTVARVHGGERRGRRRPPAREAPEVPAAFFGLEPRMAWQPAEVALVESLGGGGGDAYRPVRTWPLASGGR